MNRPTTFRGMSYTGKWMYGHYTVLKRLNRLEPTIFEIMNPEEDERQAQWAVKPETVGMSTGNKDQRGKEIFEHDIIQDRGYIPLPYVSVANLWEVRYLNGCFWLYRASFNTTNQMYSWPEHCYPMFRVDHSVYSEVIGNIHEDAELRDQIRGTGSFANPIKSHGL